MARFGVGTMMAILFAILMGLGGAYVVRQVLNQPEEDPVVVKKPQRTVSVPVVLYDIPVGRVLKRNDLSPMSMTEEEFNKSRYAKSSAFMQSVTQIIGRRVQTPISKGDVVQVAALYMEGDGPKIEDRMKPGTLAKPLPIDVNDPVLRSLSPGSIVDVYFRAEEGGVTVTLLERVEVLQVGSVDIPIRRSRTSLRDSTGTRQQRVPTVKQVRDVTIAVSPYQAKALAMVEGQGDIRLALRRKSDYVTLNGVASESRMTIGQLLRLPTGVSQHGMSVYLGGARQDLIFNQKAVYDERNHMITPVPAAPPAAPIQRSTAGLR